MPEADTTTCPLEPVRNGCGSLVEASGVDREDACKGETEALFCYAEGYTREAAVSCIVHEPRGRLFQTSYGYATDGCEDWRSCSEQEWDLLRNAPPCD